mmetsp:Transcript_32056/g.61678  ORF Transcript_32056/g.61678 Transcript_32056/m.61678 type:complete len:279 (-) Transcript_32056:42-878(-)
MLHSPAWLIGGQVARLRALLPSACIRLAADKGAVGDAQLQTRGGKPVCVQCRFARVDQVLQGTRLHRPLDLFDEDQALVHICGPERVACQGHHLERQAKEVQQHHPRWPALNQRRGVGHPHVPADDVALVEIHFANLHEALEVGGAVSQHGGERLQHRGQAGHVHVKEPEEPHPNQLDAPGVCKLEVGVVVGAERPVPLGLRRGEAGGGRHRHRVREHLVRAEGPVVPHASAPQEHRALGGGKLFVKSNGLDQQDACNVRIEQSFYHRILRGHLSALP